MKVAIHKSPWGFSHDWIKYCEKNNVAYLIVNCYESDIIEQLQECDVLLWHHHHTNAKDTIFAKQLLYAIEQSGKRVFPDFNSGWHFDDKVGQKYLLEAINAPLVPSYVFYSKKKALLWAEKTTFPKVFKLRGGAGSNNVKLAKNKNEGIKLINQSFSRGFPNYDRWNDLKENVRFFKMRIINYNSLFKSIRRIFTSTRFAKVRGKEIGYAYFQDFIPNNTCDIRVLTIGDSAIAIKRLVRANDFRASGSGFIIYDKIEIDEKCVKIAFETSKKLNAQVVAYDFVFDKENPLIVEISYGYAHQAYFDCPGFWTRDMVWHEKKINSADWIIDGFINR